MLSKYLLIPFVLGALVFFYIGWNVDSDYAIYMAPFVVGAAAVYMLSPQIDWWQYQRKPPELDARLRHILNTQMPFYQNLSVENKTKFRHRIALYLEANEFIPKGSENVPVDVRGIVAACAVQLTLGLKDYLMGKFEHIIVYPHPFPSPQHTERWHACELFEEDGVIMFSSEQLMAGFVKPARYFNIGLYEYARVFQRCNPQIAFPVFDEYIWDKLERISGFSLENIEKWIGLPAIDPLGVAVSHFFIFPEKFKDILPGEFAALSKIFNPCF
ncbi:MAG: zinc-dependent peptidase [Saprospiraceae bacterium]